MLRPNRRTWPASGRKSPAMHRSSTVFPEPLPPMMTRVTPRGSVSDTPRSTSTVSKLLRRSMTSTRGWLIAVSPEQHEKELGQEEVGDDHRHGHVHDGGGGRAPEALGPAFRAEAVVAADEGHQRAEYQALGHAGEEILGDHPVGGDVPEGEEIDPALEGHDGHGSPEADQVGQHGEHGEDDESGQQAR